MDLGSDVLWISNCSFEKREMATIRREKALETGW
jgi:hypothetical protein